MTTTTTKSIELDQIVLAIHARQRFVISSHAKPDGDSIGSQLAMALALRALAKDVSIVNVDPAPSPWMSFPGVGDIQIADHIDAAFDAAIIMECGAVSRTGVTGLERQFLINIDHHPDNTGFGQINWFDGTAAACGEMVYELIRALGVPFSRDIATHIYLAILTDTGSFHYSSMSPRTFDICREALVAGVDPILVARTAYESYGIGRLKLTGALLSAMQLDATGRIAIFYLDQEMVSAAGCTYEDTEGLVNLPLNVNSIRAVVLFKQAVGNQYRVSMRSKGDIDVGAVAKAFGGGGHKNAAGCSAEGPIAALQAVFVEKVDGAIRRSEGSGH